MKQKKKESQEYTKKEREMKKINEEEESKGIIETSK